MTGKRALGFGPEPVTHDQPFRRTVSAALGHGVTLLHRRRRWLNPAAEFRFGAELIRYSAGIGVA
jgi:hypothetical protein